LAIGGIHVGAGIFCFFLGGGIYMTFKFQCRNSNPAFSNDKRPVLGLCIAIIALYPLTLIQSHHLKIIFACVIILPAIVYLLAWLQFRSPDRGKSWIIIGDLTYASYLLHFPVQIVFHTLFLLYGPLNPAHIGTLVLFILVTYGISYVTYRCFELPAKNVLRDRLR
jgi:peptidoglycan/LPS O-acetylase OafA/YrhL